MQIIDKRTNPVDTTFGKLNIGDAFEDSEGLICIKIDVELVMFWDKELHEWDTGSLLESDLVKPLEVTYTFERKR